MEGRAVVHDPGVRSGGAPIAGEMAKTLDAELEEFSGSGAARLPVPTGASSASRCSTPTGPMGSISVTPRCSVSSAAPQPGPVSPCKGWRDGWLSFETAMVAVDVLP